MMPAPTEGSLMSPTDENDEVFAEEDLADGFDEELIVDDAEGDETDIVDLDDADVDEEIVSLIVDDADQPIVVVATDDDDVVDDADVELALDEVLAETVRRSTTPEEDDDISLESDPLVDALETILPKQDDEFRCKSCRLLKKISQLADPAKSLCRDCV
jgi:hypothetical protein